MKGFIVCTFALLSVLPIVADMRPADVNPCYRSCDFTTPMTCTYNWTVDYFYTMAYPQCGSCPSDASDCSNPGCFPADGTPRTVSLINQVFPGPSIQICSGDEVVINVTNNMLNSEGVTIHWHGIFQNGSQYMDGVPMVTQCPIPSPGNFVYRFVPYEPGTHWYHSHTGLQRADGMMGPFVIRENRRTDPQGNLYDEDIAEHVIFLNDWHHSTMVSVYERDKWGGGSSVDSILINGKGIAPGNNPPHPPLEVFNVERGKRYRFRVINGASSFCNMQFSVQNHSLRAIASDGGSFQPQAVDYFRISGGERMDFVLETNQAVDNYQIQVIGLNCTNTQGGPSKQIAYLHYDGAGDLSTPDALPDIEQFGNSSTWWQAFPDKSFAEVNSVDANYRATSGAEGHQEYIQVSLVSHIDPSTQQSNLFPQLNNISFYFPTSPVLTQFDDLPESIFCRLINEHTVRGEHDFAPVQCDGDRLCSCVHTIDVDLNKIIEVILVNPDSEFSVLHPMHLHGQQFKIVAMDKVEGATVEMVRELVGSGQINRNENGTWKDVVVVPNGGYTIFQFQAWNPGWWIFHCHIEFHLKEGMALLFNVSQGSGALPPVPKAFPTCGVWSPKTEGSGDPESRDLGTTAPTNDSEICQEALVGSSPLIYLAWVVPLTFVFALVIGVVIGCVLGGKESRARSTASSARGAGQGAELTTM